MLRPPARERYIADYRNISFSQPPPDRFLEDTYDQDIALYRSVQSEVDSRPCNGVVDALRSIVLAVPLPAARVNVCLSSAPSHNQSLITLPGSLFQGATQKI